MNKALSLFLAAGTSHSAQDAGLDRAALLRAGTQKCEGPCRESPGKSGLRPDAFAALRDSCEHGLHRHKRSLSPRRGLIFTGGLGFLPGRHKLPNLFAEKTFRKSNFIPAARKERFIGQYEQACVSSVGQLAAQSGH